MSMWNRIRNVFRREALAKEIEDELADHVAEGGRIAHSLRVTERSRDVRLMPWLDSLASDVVFGWRQLKRNRAAAAGAVISLGLAIGSATSAFRLIDALLLRPLPVASPERLYVIATQVENEIAKTKAWADASTYPLFREMRDAVKDLAHVMVISPVRRLDLTYGSDADMEKATRQYVSGDVFTAFGLKPALGRLLTSDDDRTPGAHPVAVISHDYWERRFGRDVTAIGKTFREGGTDLYEIVGVLEKGFTGTETGSTTDYFIPAMQNAGAIDHAGWSWFRAWVSVPEESRLEAKEKLRAVIAHHHAARMKTWPTHSRREAYTNSVIELEPAQAGASGMQKQYRHSLIVLGVVVGLVLLIACANVANLMMAQAAARAREMALRVSIGAGRWRLIQLVLLESAMIAVLATMLGALFAWWSAPFVVGMINPPDDPARLALPADWRVLAFVATLALTVTILCGLMPAWRASSVKPILALKGGKDPHSRGKLMNFLVAAQVAFCFLAHFGAGLFAATLDRLSNQPLGFEATGVLTLETRVKGRDGSWMDWDEVLNAVKRHPGVESAALGIWALLSGYGWNEGATVNGKRIHPTPYHMGVSPGWFHAMRLSLAAGREFRPGERYPDVAILNESFVANAFGSENPLGKGIDIDTEHGPRRVQIVGVVKDARYRDMREPIQPTIYVPFEREEHGRDWATIIVRTKSGKPEALTADLRATVNRIRSDFRVSNAVSQIEHVRKHTIRERLLAMLSLFFAGVALILAAVGLYGVLNYSVLQRRREIGIRMALGAQPADVIRRVGADVFGMLILGSVVGLTLGLLSERFVETILFGVKATDLRILITPAITLALAAVFAAVPPMLRAVRIDPAETLRSE